jgi:hypothetical protein
MGGELSYDAFVAAFERGDCDALLRKLEAEIVRRLTAATERCGAATAIAHELKALGHDLYSFDEDDDFQLWCGNWVKGAVVPPFELGLELSWRGDAVEAVAWFKPRSVG